MRNLYLMEYSGGGRKEIFLKRIDNGLVKKNVLKINMRTFF